MFSFFAIGAVIATIYVTKTTAELSRLIKLHQVEHLRRTLVISIQTTQSDLYAINTHFSRKLNAIVKHGANLEEAAAVCTSCHHPPPIYKRLIKLQDLVEDYQSALSYYITASANEDRIRELADTASAKGNNLLLVTEQMSFEASKKLQKVTNDSMSKIEDVKIILFATVVSTFFMGLIVSVLLTRSIIKPIKELLDATRMITSGSYDHKITFHDRTEFGELARNFNIMSDALKEKNKLEEQLKHSQKMEAIGTLTAGVAHEYNNVMTSIIGFGELLQEDLDTDSHLREYVDDILISARRATGMTKSLLAYSRKQITHMEPVVVNEAISSVQRFLSKFVHEDIELMVLLSSENLTIMADKSQLEQVFINLSTNALDAMPEGGKLIIKLESVKLSSLQELPHAEFEPGTYVLISVTDTGVGMDDKIKEKIFEPFYTTKDIGKGTGLGLSMVYGIIKRHNGYIFVDSVPGKGSNFKVFLPQIDFASVEVEPATAINAEKGTETVLIAEDEELVLKLMKKTLEKEGYRIITAINGEDAVQKHARYKGEIDLLFFDVAMPGKDGKQAYEEIRKTDPDVKVIFISGYGELNDPRIRSILDEGKIIINKPVKKKELLKQIRMALGSLEI
jgi:hypothetical protein